MAVFKFTHSTGIVKSLMVAAVLALAGVAHADDSAYKICGPTFPNLYNADDNNIDCWRRVMANKVIHGERLDLSECSLVDALDGYVQQCADDGFADPERVAAREAARARTARPGPKETPLCVGNCR